MTDECEDVGAVPPDTSFEESYAYKHAMREFQAAGWTDEHGVFKDGMQRDICDHVIDLLKVFFDEGHSGTSAPYAINLFSKLAKFETLVPLSGEDSEWSLVTEGLSGDGVTVYQNNRCSRVFKQSDQFDGQAYDINGKVFWEWYSSPDIDNGKPYKNYFTNSDSFVKITFPYTPETVYEERTLENE